MIILAPLLSSDAKKNLSLIRISVYFEQLALHTFITEIKLKINLILQSQNVMVTDKPYDI